MTYRQESLGFTFQESADKVHISRDGRYITTLTGKAASSFVTQITSMTEEQQQRLMAKKTGNYKRGNEKQAKARN
ncbi:hypothetical protein [Vibrio sp. SCSIO 43137]|uniref:hypothetical protein n=1 Tax=Vibrio sp. SCSIO 43137 TaxID=3021011 RepID=UPI00230772B0|nr:hypothetical protein [Vibrio sp. SCSIO 43137]WCE28841.1 hypothetical protein PK654_10770 [Vibrio sp. SCSIO 43137]